MNSYILTLFFLGLMEEKEELIAYCGLYCDDCHGHNGRIPDLARDLRKELRAARYEKFAEFISGYSFGKDFAGYDECYKVLGAMVKFRCCKGCRAGGGSPFCKIRKCAESKELEGCWECGEFEECDKLQLFKLFHGDNAKGNLRKIKKYGLDRWARHRRKFYKWL